MEAGSTAARQGGIGKRAWRALGAGANGRLGSSAAIGDDACRSLNMALVMHPAPREHDSYTRDLYVKGPN